MSKKLRIVIIIVALIVFCVSAFRLGWSYYQEITANRGLDSIRPEAVLEIPPSIPDEVPFSTISVDFDALYGINRDIIAWLYIPDTPVSYPILFGTDNHHYLTTTFDKKTNVLGSIFMDYRNNSYFEDLNTIIYGHNTRNDSMFGSLKRFKDQAYADENKYVHIIRDSEVRVYEIFSIYETPATSNTYTIQFSSDESYAEYLNEMAQKTIINAGSLTGLESIITLSTCTTDNRAARLVLQAVLVEIHNV
jgi:sortase B